MGEKRKKRPGDRYEGRRLRTISPYMAITPFIMRNRSDACNYFSDTAEITAADRFLRQKRMEGMKGLGLLHLFVAAYVRAVSAYPSVNRFVAGRRVYARNEIIVIMTIKRTMAAEGEETSIKVHLSPADTIYDVYNKMEAAISDVKNDVGNSTDSTASALMKLPRWILNFAISLLMWLDYHWGLPKWLLDASPFHGSIVVTDVASLGIQPIYHHIYDFGNLPCFLGFGAKYRRTELDSEGKPVQRKYVDYKVVTDERITDGYNYAAAFRLFNRCVSQICLG